MSAITRSAVGGLLLLMAAGCAAQTPAPPPFSSPPGQATLTITRSTMPYAAIAGADVALNGSKIASLALGQSYSGAVAPGPNVLTVSCWCGPGSYSASFTAAPGQRYAFTVAPRWTAAGAAAAGGIVGVAADAAANGDRSGPFVITEN